MKYINLILFTVFVNHCFAQKKETIKIPNGIVYNYCDPKKIEEAKNLITNNLSNTANYEILQQNLIIGPELWKRFRDNENIKKIQKGRVEFHVDNLVLEGKMSQDINDSKIIWEEFKKEVSQDYTIRKANEQELKYYWSVISFDIDEPLLIIETKEHNYILNLLKKDLKLMWLDEAPKTKGYTVYENGEEKTSISKGEKETKLESIVFLNDDETLKKNTSVKDLSLILEKCSNIFNTLFKDSTKEGKIMLQFELTEKETLITFSIKDDVDLDIMKEFEKQINSEKFPNSKKDPIQFQMLFKINSYNETE